MKDRLRDALQYEARHIDAPHRLKAGIRREIRARLRRKRLARFAVRLVFLAVLTALVMLLIRTCL